MEVKVEVKKLFCIYPMIFLCLIIGAFFHSLSVTMEALCALDTVKKHSILYPIILIDKNKTVSNFFGKRDGIF